MMRVSKTCSSPAVGARTAWNTGRPAVCAIDPIEHEAVQMDVQIGGRSEALDQRDGAGVGFGALEFCLLDQNRNYRDVMPL
jgi:guanyl-specific ribonuclease Sa